MAPCLFLLSCIGLAIAADDAQTLVQTHLQGSPVEAAKLEREPSGDSSSWPDCQQLDVRIKSGPEDLFADLTDYGGVSGCTGDDCSESDEMSSPDANYCALVCATTTNCKFWTWGYEASKAKCWLRSGDKALTDKPAEAEGYITGTMDCRPDADFSADFDHPVTGQVIEFLGQDCPSGSEALNLNGRDYLMLGPVGGKPSYYNKDSQTWLYYDRNCNGKSGDEGWYPHWVITPKPPSRSDIHSGDHDGDGKCEAGAYSFDEGDKFGPLPSAWQVDCNGAGLTTKTLAMDILRFGLMAEFSRTEDCGTNSSDSCGDEVTLISSRIDYWTTGNVWRGLPDVFTGPYSAKFTGWLKISEAGDYFFSLGTSDVASLEWHHPESDTWAAYNHDGEGTFSYSSIEDHTPETVRALDAGYHRFRVRFQRKYDQAAGLVLKYKGTDSNNSWKVVPSAALYVKPPGCVAPGSPEPICIEGFIIASGEKCTVNNTIACPEDQIADPSVLVCEPPHQLAPSCVISPAALEAEQKAKAEAQAEAEEKSKNEAEQKDKAETEAEEKEKAEAEEKAKADAEAMKKAQAVKPEPAIPGYSVARWR